MFSLLEKTVVHVIKSDLNETSKDINSLSQNLFNSPRELILLI